MLLVDDYKRQEQAIEMRIFKAIDLITIWQGRKEPIAPEDIFPLLKGLKSQVAEDEDDDIDPREAFSAIESMTRAKKF